MASFDCLSLCYFANLTPAGGKKIGPHEYAFHCPGPNHSRGDKKPSLLVNKNKGKGGYWKCFPCNVGGGRWQLAAFLSGFSWPSDYKLVLNWLRERGFINYATERKSQRATAGKVKYKLYKTS